MEDEREAESFEAFEWLMKEENQKLYLSGSDEGLPKLVKLAKYFLSNEKRSKHYVFPDFIVL